MENQEFQIQFINHFCFYLSTRFKPDYVNEHITNTVINISDVMPNHIDKWGGSISQWYQNVNAIILFGNLRLDYVFNHLSSYFGLSESSTITVSSSPAEGGNLYTSNQKIPENPWEATYFNGVPIEITAVPNPGYIFSHWAGPGVVYESTLT